MGSSSAPARRRTAAVLVLAAATALLVGCYWSKYDKLARTHVALLVAMADKIADVCATGEAPASLAEYRYPLERARDFARIVGRRYADRASLAAFLVLCDDYERVLAAAERCGSGGGRDVGSPALASARVELTTQAQAVLAALDRERG